MHLLVVLVEFELFLEVYDEAARIKLVKSW